MKKFTAWLACLILAVSLVLPVWADFYPAGADENYVYCAGVALEQGTQVTSPDGDCAVTTPAQANIPITYYCMVDLSSALSIRQFQQQPLALQTISSNMRPIDRMIIATMGEELEISPALTDQAARAQAIEALTEHKARYTEVYQNIVDSLDYLQGCDADAGVRCIVLMTDGIDNSRSPEISENKVAAALSAGSIPLHTLSIVDPFPESYSLKYVSLMDSFSKQSPGGVQTAPNRDNITVEQAVQQIMDAALNSAVVRVSAAGLSRSGETAQLELRWPSGSGTASIPTELLPVAVVETEPETQAPTVPETVAETVPVTEPAPTSTALWDADDAVFKAIIGVAAAAVFVVMILVIVLSRKPVRAPAPVQTANSLPRKDLPDFDYPAMPKEAGKDDAENEFLRELPREQPKRAERPAAKSADSAKAPAAEAAKPASAVKPATPTAPVKPAAPAASVKPAAPTSPMKPAAPTVPAKPAAPAASAKPIVPAAPVRPAAPAASVKPAAPTTPVQPAVPAVPGCKVRMEAVDFEDNIVEFFLPVNTGMTVGRNSRSDVILNETDRGLSGVHFELQWDGRVLHLRDRSSTNGTVMGNIPLRPEKWARLSPDALIHAGSFTYRISAKKTAN